MSQSNGLAFLNGDAVSVARRLLGCQLVRQMGSHQLVGTIVETEAYNQTDAASHSYKGRTPRTDVMFGPPGRLYVYFTYGMHYCCNVVVGPADYGAAVLIRALQPVEGIEQMTVNRHGMKLLGLTSGPAKLCQAFSIDRTLNGHDLTEAPLWLKSSASLREEQVVQTVRIGIKRAVEEPWRFYIKDNPYVSRNA